MKILIPSLSIEDSFTENVAFTLKEMGHDVHTLGTTTASGLRMEVHRRAEQLTQKLFPERPTAEDVKVLGYARALRPDMVLALTRCFSSEVLADLRRAGVRHLVAWWGDPPANMQQRGLLVDGWDHIFIKDPDAARKLRRVGLPAQFMFEAMNPTWHRPQGSARNSEVAVVGNFYAFRQMLVRRLIDANVEVALYGERLPRWVDTEISRRHKRRAVYRSSKSQVFHEALACLNSMHVAEGNSLNCRAFEIAGAAGLQIVEARPIIEEAFEPGKELLVFDSIAEILDHLERARRPPAEVESIRNAGHQRALAHHTYRHRLERILEACGS